MTQLIKKKNESKTSFRTLVVDDNVPWTKTTKEYLTTRSSKIKVDIAHDPKDATSKIKSTSYDALLVDTNLKGSIQGDEWLLSKLDLIPTPHKYIITGYPSYINDFTELEKNGIRVVIKATEEEIEALDDIINESKKAKMDKSDEIEKEEETKLEIDLGVKVVALAREAFLNGSKLGRTNYQISFGLEINNFL